jgi:peptidoglycan/xylan/chitin deacetylase (PgdA/CDA1 family)
LDGHPLPGASVVLTFDDGLMDHWTAACEVLDPLGIRGAFFVCSRPAAEKRALTVHKNQWLRAHTPPADFATEFFSLVPSELRPTGREPWAARAASAYKYDSPLEARLKFALNFVLSRELVDEITSTICARRGLDERRFCEQTYMSEEHLRALVGRGHVVGVHGHTHAPFARLDEHHLLEEVGSNVVYLTGAIGGSPTWIAYPYGRADAIPDEPVLNRLFSRFNFRIGLTLMGTWNTANESRTRLNRINNNEIYAVVGGADTAASAAQI